MVALFDVEASDASIATSLPVGMVGVFVGATGGIGEFTLKAFAQHSKKPKIYFVGRAQEEADRIICECNEINPGGVYTFIKSDISLLKNVDDVCKQILAKEDCINLLFQTQGTMVMQKTSEGLPMSYVLPVTSRILFAINLLPALQRATGLKRVVSVFAGGYEGFFDDQDWAGFPARKLLKSRGHIASMLTMANNVMARQAPDVSFVHNYPGAVKTNFGKDVKGPAAAVGRVVFSLLGNVIFNYLSPAECGARQLYAATSARFPPVTGDAVGVPLPKYISKARGTDGMPGSGSYTINFDAENVSLDVDKHLAKAKANGAEEKLWTYILEEIKQAISKAR